MAEVISTISAVIALIEVSIKTYDSAKKDIKLSETFKTVRRRLPVILHTLATCKENLEPRKDSIPEDVCEALEATLDVCRTKASYLEEIFQKTVPGGSDTREQRYSKNFHRIGKGNKVEELMLSLAEEVKLVINHDAVKCANQSQNAELENIMDEMESFISGSYKESTTVNFSAKGGPQTNNVQRSSGNLYTVNGDGRQYIGGTQYFVWEHECSKSAMEKEEECLRDLFLTNPVDDRNALKRRKGDRATGTCDWILESNEIMHWLHPPESLARGKTNIFWLYGNPGTGKSTIAITITEELPGNPLFTHGQKTLAYFFCDSTSENQRTALAILRGLIYQLVKQCPLLMKHILPKYLEWKEYLCTSFDALWAILVEMGQDSPYEIYCVVDAIDECEYESQQVFLSQIQQTFHKQSRRSSSLHILITSRPYPEIGEFLSQFNHKDLASYDAVKKDLEVMIQEKVRDLSKRKSYTERITKEVSRILEEKAGGTFLWVGIACIELAQPQMKSRNAVSRLEKMPAGLYALYEQLLSNALEKSDDSEDNKETIVDLLKFVAFARRPLTLPELCSLCQLDCDYDERSRLQFTKELVEICRLMIVVQDGHVKLLHKSVKDFLIQGETKLDSLNAHAELANRCIAEMVKHSDFFEARKQNVSMMEYATQCWPEHAELAEGHFAITSDNKKFFTKGSEQ